MLDRQPDTSNQWAGQLQFIIILRLTPPSQPSRAARPGDRYPAVAAGPPGVLRPPRPQHRRRRRRRQRACRRAATYGARRGKVIDCARNAHVLALSAADA